MIYKTDNQGKLNCRGTQSFVLKISLADIFPEIYRIVTINANHRAFDLHLPIQGAFEWRNKHCFRFEVDGEDLKGDLQEV